MKLWEALKALEEKQKVRMKDWDQGTYLKIMREGSSFDSKTFFYRYDRDGNILGQLSMIDLSNEDLMGNNWEILIEKVSIPMRLWIKKESYDNHINMAAYSKDSFETLITPDWTDGEMQGYVKTDFLFKAEVTQ